MTRTRISLSLFLALACIQGCAGSAARTHTLWPMIVSAWPAVREDVALGADAGGGHTPASRAAVAQIDQAVSADDRHMLLGVDARTIESLARDGVQARVDSGSISVGVSMSLLERVLKLSQALQEMAQ